MVAWLKQLHSQPSLKETFLETCTTFTWEVPSVGSPRNYKRASKTKTLLFLPTITHSYWSTCLRSKPCPNTSSLHTPLNRVLIQSTSPLNGNPPFGKGNFMCLMGASPNIKPPYKLLLSRISWPSIPRSTHSPFPLQASGIPNHVV